MFLKIKIIILIFLCISMFTCINKCQNRPKKYLIKELPINAKIQNIYFEKPFINGDYFVRAKINITEKEFKSVMEKMGLNITQNEDRVFRSMRYYDWWGIGKNTDKINPVYYKSGAEYYMYSFYVNGFMYYLDKGW